MTTETDTFLEVKNASRSYGGVKALDNCSIKISEGKITGLIGPNGSGKTTLFNAITGYESIEGGEVYFRGQPITGKTPEQIFALGIGRTFQLTKIFARMTVMENMFIATQRREGWLRSVIRPAGSSEELDRAVEILKFVGLLKLADSPAGSLSYGQRKLLELAYILIADPTLLLLDEPAGGVNLSLIKELGDHIRYLNSLGKTFLIVEHNMDFVLTLCHEVNVMSSGSVFMTGKPEQVRSDPRVLDAYLGIDDFEEEIVVP